MVGPRHKDGGVVLGELVVFSPLHAALLPVFGSLSVRSGPGPGPFWRHGSYFGERLLEVRVDEGARATECGGSPTEYFGNTTIVVIAK